MILAVGEVLMEFRRVEADGEVALPGTWQGPFCSGAPAIFASVAARVGAPAGLAGRSARTRSAGRCASGSGATASTPPR